MNQKFFYHGKGQISEQCTKAVHNLRKKLFYHGTKIILVSIEPYVKSPDDCDPDNIYILEPTRDSRFVLANIVTYYHQDPAGHRV